MLRAFLLLFLVAACSSHGGAGQAEIASNDCVACHESDLLRVEEPPHIGNFPETCGDCHDSVAWMPALEGLHPENAFPIARGSHSGQECSDCHDISRGPSFQGMNTDCVGCHTGEHSERKSNAQHKGVDDYRFEPDRPSFCLDCHPDGRE